MPPERNTRSMVELPELLVSGLLHESDSPTLLGSVAFSRATLSNTIWLSEGERPRPKFPLNGMTWACAAERNSQVASEANRHDRVQDFITVPLCRRRHPLVRLHTNSASARASALIENASIIKSSLRTR